MLKEILLLPLLFNFTSEYAIREDKKIRMDWNGIKHVRL
jgi:hypothetical protein